jgi:anti-sigma factor RsiW
MSIPTLHDIEQLSAFLDGQLGRSQKTRLEARLKADPAFAEALEQLRQVRTMLNRAPHRRAPRNFTLTPKMAGIRPPVPRLVPALSWASAVAMLLFLFTLGINLLGQGALSAAAPKAADMYGLGGGPAAPATAAPATVAPALVQSIPPAAATHPPVAATIPPVAATMAPAAATIPPVASQPPVNGFLFAVTAEVPTAALEATPEATPQVVTRATAPVAGPIHEPRPAFPWPYIWLALAILLVGAALLIRWLNERAFARRTRH